MQIVGHRDQRHAHHTYDAIVGQTKNGLGHVRTQSAWFCSQNRPEDPLSGCVTRVSSLVYEPDWFDGALRNRFFSRVKET